MKPILDYETLGHVIPTNFIKTDSGRSKSKRPKQSKDCTIRALVEVTERSYDEIYDWLAKKGRKCNNGFHLQKLLDKACNKNEKILGHNIKKYSFPAKKDIERMYVGAFCLLYPKGKFITRQAKHVGAVIDGKVHDLSWNCFRCIYTAFEFIEI